MFISLPYDLILYVEKKRSKKRNRLNWKAEDGNESLQENENKSVLFYLPKGSLISPLMEKKENSIEKAIGDKSILQIIRLEVPAKKRGR